MRQKLKIILALTAWFVASGTHWDLVQVFAWGKMFANYAPAMSITRAAELTFNPENMCALCKTVTTAKRQQDAALPSDLSQLAKKALLLFQPTPRFVLSVFPNSPWLVRETTPQSLASAAPPTPPPRRLAA